MALSFRAPGARAQLVFLASLCGFTTAGCDLMTGPSAVPDRFVMVSAGSYHTCAISEEGQAYCWGKRNHHQIGTGTGPDCADEFCLSAVPVPDARGLSRIAAGTNHTCALGHEQVSCWGYNRFGELGDGLLLTTPCPEAPHVRCSPAPFPVALGFPVVDLSGSRRHTCAVTASGAAYCWGSGAYGQLGAGIYGDHSLPIRVVTEQKFVEISAGDAHTCALTAEGAGFCWGGGPSVPGGSPVPVPIAGDATFLTITAGGRHTCGVSSGGVALCWGSGADGRLGLGDLADHVTPTPVPVPEAVTAVDAGWAHTCAIGDSGTLYCWGLNAHGQVGQPGGGVVLEPTVVDLPTPARQVSVGESHTCAVATTGAIYCWGVNHTGQLGDGTRRGKFVPVRGGAGGR